MNKAKAAFKRQQWDAANRRIEFLFTFENWCHWWETHLGQDWLELRGCKKGQFVMARFKDKGPYAPWNVRPLTVEMNHVEYNIHHNAPKGKQRGRLKESLIKAVFLADGEYEEIAQRFGIERFRVHCIKTKKYYRNVTDNL